MRGATTRLALVAGARQPSCAEPPISHRLLVCGVTSLRPSTNLLDLPLNELVTTLRKRASSRRTTDWCTFPGGNTPNKVRIDERHSEPSTRLENRQVSLHLGRCEVLSREIVERAPHHGCGRVPANSALLRKRNNKRSHLVRGELPPREFAECGVRIGRRSRVVAAAGCYAAPIIGHRHRVTVSPRRNRRHVGAHASPQPLRTYTAR